MLPCPACVPHTGDQLKHKGYMKPVMREVPAAQDPPKRPFRKRPFIYV